MSGDYSIQGLSREQIQQALDYFNNNPSGMLHASFHKKGYYGATGDHIHVEDWTKSSAKIVPSDLNNLEE